MTTGSEQYPLYDPISNSAETMPEGTSSVGSGGYDASGTPLAGIPSMPSFPINSNSGAFDWQTLSGSIDPYLAQRLALIAGAWNNYNNAGQYSDTSNTWANRSDPFGQYRAQYGKMLSDSYTDPMAFLNNPEHRAIQERQMNILQGRNRAAGFMNSGKDLTDLSDYLAKSDNEYLTQQRELLGKMAGMNLNPADAARIMMQGQDQSIKAKNDALGNIVQAITPVPRNSPSTVVNNGTNGSSGTGAGMNTATNALLSKIDPRTGISFLQGIQSGYYGDIGGSGGYGGEGTGIDPTNPVDYSVMNAGGYGSMSGGGGYEGEGTGIDVSQYSDPSYWSDYFTSITGDY